MDKFSESAQHTFLDYLSGGCELNFMVAIDFTGIHVRSFCPSTMYFVSMSYYIYYHVRTVFQLIRICFLYASLNLTLSNLE